MPQARRNPDPKIAYLDLFAGPGRYKDGTKSTPLLILEKAIQDDAMSQMLVTIFNDRDDNNAQDFAVGHQPTAWNSEVETQADRLEQRGRL